MALHWAQNRRSFKWDVLLIVDKILAYLLAFHSVRVDFLFVCFWSSLSENGEISPYTLFTVVHHNFQGYHVWILSLFNPGLHSTYKKTQHNRHNGSSAFGVYRKEKGRVGLFSVSFIAPEMGRYLVVTRVHLIHVATVQSPLSVLLHPTPSLVNVSY